MEDWTSLRFGSLIHVAGMPLVLHLLSITVCCNSAVAGCPVHLGWAFVLWDWWPWMTMDDHKPFIPCFEHSTYFDSHSHYELKDNVFFNRLEELCNDTLKTPRTSPPICSMLLEYLRTFTIYKWPRCVVKSSRCFASQATKLGHRRPSAATLVCRIRCETPPGGGSAAWVSQVISGGGWKLEGKTSVIWRWSRWKHDKTADLEVNIKAIQILYLVGGDWNMNFIFPYIWNSPPNWLIFFRGVETTNQIQLLCSCFGANRRIPKRH